jgi:phage shock protein A
MGLFSRFKRAMKANINDMISKSENPEKMLNQLIVEMNEQLVESKKTVAASIADEKRLERQVASNRELSDEWERKAMLAVRAGKDDLAKEALLRKQEYDNTIRQYQSQWEAQHASVEQLKSSLRGLQQKIEEAQRKKNLLIARVKRAEAQKRMQQTVSSMSDTSAFEAFDRMAEKVEQIEAELDAMKEIEPPTSGDRLEQQFRALEGAESSADKMLEDLKSRMARLEDKSGEDQKD